MSAETVINAIKATLEKRLPRTVFIGYGNLEQHNLDGRAVILQLQGGTLVEDTYGDNFTRTWRVLADVYSYVDLPDAAHLRLVQTVDSVVLAIEEYPYLGKGKSAGVRVQVSALEIGEAEPVQTEEGVTNWLRATIVIVAEEDVTTAAKE